MVRVLVTGGACGSCRLRAGFVGYWCYWDLLTVVAAVGGRVGCWFGETDCGMEENIEWGTRRES